MREQPVPNGVVVVHNGLKYTDTVIYRFNLKPGDQSISEITVYDIYYQEERNGGNQERLHAGLPEGKGV